MARKTCRECGKVLTSKSMKCPSCGEPVSRKKTMRQAYSKGGLGVIDLIPGVRDLPYGVRLVLMIILVAFLLILIRS